MSNAIPINQEAYKEMVQHIAKCQICPSPTIDWLYIRVVGRLVGWFQPWAETVVTQVMIKMHKSSQPSLGRRHI